ncbi:Lipase 1 [Penicillium rolfsii]|nr:Lipase 1 [Penicillium rolfsii]
MILYSLLTVYFIGVYFVLAARTEHDVTNPPSVTVVNGTYFGLHNTQYNQDIFLGMPFAQQPVGDLRLHVPQSLNTSWSLPRNATEYSPSCRGYRQTAGASEACLTLNVVRPRGFSPQERLPVAVWIYGGGFTSGSSSDSRYNLSYIVNESVKMGKPMIAASLNYRLHCWGFMWSKEIQQAGAGNLGFRDQRLALHWIQENIAAFGGDPTQATIWGESAGAHSVGTHLVAYGGRDDGLFRAAISESGAPSVYARYQTPDDWQPYYNAIVSAAGCSSATDTLACLRSIPAETLQGIFDNSSIVPVHTLTGLDGPQFIPVIDGDFIEESATIQLRKGRFVKVPYLIGGNADEGTSFGVRGINTDAQFQEIVTNWGFNNATAETLQALYPDIPEIGIPATIVGRPSSQYGDQYKRVAAFQGDMDIHSSRRLASQIWSAYNVSAYSYLFDVSTAGSYSGANHGSEVPYVFHNLDGVGNIADVNSKEVPLSSRQRLSTLMSRMWVSFVTTLDPNIPGESSTKWPVYDKSDPKIIFFDTNVTSLVYVNLDVYRAEGMKYISDRLESIGR